MAFIEIKTNKKLYYIECKYFEQSKFDITIDCITTVGEKKNFLFILGNEAEFFRDGTDEVLEYIKKENGNYLYKFEDKKVTWHSNC